MARLSAGGQSSGRKETTTTKKAAATAKNSGHGVWPCEMNGCDKQFAREADLKRHQRTTKLHSMAGFACPQCEANFTRADALRRHQKSRHNDPMESEQLGETPQSGGAVAFLSKRNGPETVIPETIQGTPSATGPATGHISYYRESVASSSYASPPCTAVTTEWPNGSSAPHSGQTAYMYVTHRHDTTGDMDSHIGISSSPSSVSSHSQQYESEEPTSPTLHSSKAISILAPIPPLPPPVQLAEPLHLDAEPNRTSGSSSSEHQCSQEEGFSHNTLMKPTRTWIMSDEADMSGEESGYGNLSASPSSSFSESPPVSKSSHIMREHGYGSRLIRPEPLEPILTENGEPMLDPAELLTQVGLNCSL
ncbi:hypothetical protein J3R30DRAFT_1134797 [Lentinula aciculospora]|uniref:C2H2-type domain-containing protein n=1 Tax=Lentinula aciculospora TaxID=153920 RepID=A0A9W8ZZD9_9AGAR|nr:hypothetical protein J3R30DRAFT_1134797 [Lentinula aciculospora]